MRNYAGTVMMLVTTMVAAVGCYTINLRVSGERAEVDALRKRLVADAREMRNLQAELRTRARFPELQRWNDNVLQMSAPAAGQFLRSPVELASYAAVPAADQPGVVYAVTPPQAAAPVTAPLVEVAYRAANQPAGAARLIRAGYAVPQPSSALAVDFAPSHVELAQVETRRAAPSQLALHAARPAAASDVSSLERRQVEARKAEPRKPEPSRAEPRRAAPAPEDARRAPGAPIDLMPQGGQ